MYNLIYKIEEQAPYKIYDSYDSLEDAIEASGELLYDGFIVKIEENE